MGFYRQGQPDISDRSRIAAIVAPFVVQEIAFLERTADPFLVDDPCEKNGGGPHGTIPSCEDIVCCHCGKVFWQ